jgi:hypothetical protein
MGLAGAIDYDSIGVAIGRRQARGHEGGLPGRLTRIFLEKENSLETTECFVDLCAPFGCFDRDFWLQQKAAVSVVSGNGADSRIRGYTDCATDGDTDRDFCRRPGAVELAHHERHIDFD